MKKHSPVAAGVVEGSKGFHVDCTCGYRGVWWEARQSAILAWVRHADFENQKAVRQAAAALDGVRL